MDIPEKFRGLVDEARSEAKRFSDPEAGPLHAALVVASRFSEEFEARFGAGTKNLVRDALISGAGRTTGGETELEELMVAAAGSSGSTSTALLDALVPVIEAVVANNEAMKAASGTDGVPASTSDEDDAPAAGAEAPNVLGSDRSARSSEHPARGNLSAVPDPESGGGPGRRVKIPDGLARYVSIVEPAAVDYRRREVLEAAAGLIRQGAGMPILVGRRGAGRTSIVTALATFLDSDDAPSDLAGWAVVRVDGNVLLRSERAGTIRRIQEHVEGNFVLVLDDLELMCSLTSANPDVEMLAMVRSIAGDPSQPVIAVLESRHQASLEMHDSSLAPLLQMIHVDELGADDVREIVAAEASALSSIHGVTISDAVIDVACSPSKADSLIGHPGLAVSRLELAAARAVVKKAPAVEMVDLDLGGISGGPTRLDVSSLRSRLESKIVGQVAAVEGLVNRLALTQAHLDLYPHRPDGVFLFLGPTGVGKTALARAISEELFGGDSLIRLDMSEYAQEWAIARLIGPQPGYVGYTEPQGWLTTRVREKQRCVVLLDEIEKAHPRVWNTFLQVFDAGRLTDARGNVADFSNTVVVMTSNVGAESFTKSGVGFRTGSNESVVADRVLEQLRDTMSPELINRIDEVAVFRALSEEDIAAVARIEVDRAATRLRDRGFVVRISDQVVEHLARTGYDQRYGARHVQRNIERLLLQSLVEFEPGAWAADIGDSGTITWVPST